MTAYKSTGGVPIIFRAIKIPNQLHAASKWLRRPSSAVVTMPHSLSPEPASPNRVPVPPVQERVVQHGMCDPRFRRPIMVLSRPLSTTGTELQETASLLQGLSSAIEAMRTDIGRIEERLVIIELGMSPSTTCCLC